MSAFGGGGGLIKEVERRLKVTDGIIRFLTVRVDEELRKAPAAANAGA